MSKRRDSTHPDLRPIESKSIKSIIDTLRFELPDIGVLDLYSGKGRMGLAFLENGVRRVVFVEQHPSIARELRQSTKDWSEQSVVVQRDAIEFLKSCEDTFDLIFADPPFRIWNQSLADCICELAAPHINADGLLMIRFPKREATDLPSKNFECWKAKTLGESILWYLRRT